MGRFIPFLKQTYPVLTVRLAETIVGKLSWVMQYWYNTGLMLHWWLHIGKVSPAKTLVILPAHLFGAVLGVVIFKSFLPFIPNDVIQPLPYVSTWWLPSIVVEVLINFVYITILLVLPYILEINRITTKLVSLPVIPLLLCFHASTFSPAIVYALWYVNNCSSIFMNFNSLPLERIIGPILGAIFAGVFCNRYFPDDPSSWTRKKHM